MLIYYHGLLITYSYNCASLSFTRALRLNKINNLLLIGGFILPVADTKEVILLVMDCCIHCLGLCGSKGL